MVGMAEILMLDPGPTVPPGLDPISWDNCKHCVFDENNKLFFLETNEINHR
jgi:hypothetical protein